MLDDLRSVFRKTWEAFRTEVQRREPEDQVAELLGMMRREMVAARALLPELDDSIRQITAELEAERRAVADCQRRRSLAERIGDDETVRVAGEFLTRHEQTVAVLQRKLEAARAERALRGQEVEEMSRRYKQADANRFALLSQLRTHRAAERMRGGLDGTADPFAEFARMTDRIDQESAYADAVEEMSAADGPAANSSPPAAAEPDVEQRLRELKRRMGRE